MKSLTRKIRISRGLLLLVLLVLSQACAAAVVTKPTTATPGNAPREQKQRVRELTGCNGERFRIDLIDAIAAIPDDTLDAQREQLRDWIWTVTLGRIAQRTSAEEVLIGVAGEPLVRDDALAHVLHMQVGPTRSTSTKSGGAIVMVEAADAPTMAAEAAEAIDQEAIHIGSTPADAQVYQYVFQPEVARAEVCAMKPLARAELESAAQNHRSATITTATQLEGFLLNGVDLLSAQCTEAGLEVTGRQRPRAARTSVTVEQIAALAQARGTRFIPLERFGFSLEKVSNRAQLAEQSRQLDALRAPIEIQPPEIQIILAWKRQNPSVSTQALIMSLQLQKEAFGRPGFSLDPKTNATFAAELLDDIIAALPNVEKVAAILRGLKEGEHASVLLDIAGSTNEPFAAEAKATLVAARSKLQKASAEEAEAILQPNLPKSLGNAVAEGLMQAVWKHSTQQCARYDGPLYGTSTGMTLFYTDLLAKIWWFDLNGAAPEGPIEGFLSTVHAPSSTTSCDDTGGENTRIWFGVREENFTREASGAVRFAPLSTRIFAKSSNTWAKSEEFEATAESKRFVQWWDSHFPQIAGWEPQYEVLNQLMKWSVVIQSLAIADQHHCLAPLDAVAVGSNHRIDKWIAETKDLKWRGPVSLLGPPKGSKEKPGDPECMLLFESTRFSSCGFSGTIIGGVTTATREMMRAKPTRVPQRPDHVRLGLEKAPVSAGEGRVRIETLRGNGGKLKDITVESRPAKVVFGAKIDAEVSPVGSRPTLEKITPVKRFEKSIEIQGKGIVGRETKDGLVSGEIKVSDLTAADIPLQVKPSARQIAKADAQTVAKRMLNDGVEFRDAAIELTSKHKVLQLNESTIAVRIESGSQSPKWVLMESGGGNRGPPPPGAQSFVVGVRDGAPHRPGSTLASRKPEIRVSILDEKTADSFIRQQKGKPLQANDPTLTAVKDRLENKDFDGAMKAVEQNPSPGARAQLLDHALQTGNDTNVTRLVDHAIQKRGSASELRAHRTRLQNEAVRRSRDGGDRSLIDQQNMKLAIAERRQLTPEHTGELTDAAPKGDAAVYAPPSYPRAAGLPPAVHKPGKLLLPDEQYVTRAVDDVSARNLPAELDVGGAKYERRAAGRDVPLSYGAVGSSDRLLRESRRSVLVVTRCSDTAPGLPPCHRKLSPEEQQMVDQWATCDTNKDYEFSTPEERACLDALGKKPSKPAPVQSPP
jgi:hypothetical protein